MGGEVLEASTRGYPVRGPTDAKPTGTPSR